MDAPITNGKAYYRAELLISFDVGIAIDHY